MLPWNYFIEILGCSKFDDNFVELSEKFNELPSFDTGVLGDRNYYSFFQAGVLVLLENETVNQISFYIQPDEGFSAYKGALPFKGLESEIIQLLGEPSASGGGKMDMLLGYINRWIKYEKEGYALHLQFDQNGKLCRASLMCL
ncbi:hypothetical protein RABR111495_01835 [Rahnella bruchi]|uniref:hypothetical protein n=1 Tax=Rahnella bruchi TaxID=1510573 RepID=UPI000EA0B454|nr:hypothetical protein [Rahnella bruchi]